MRATFRLEAAAVPSIAFSRSVPSSADARARDSVSKTDVVTSFRSLKLCNENSRMLTFVWSVNSSSANTPDQSV